MEQFTVDQMKERVKKRLNDAYEKKRARNGRNYSQKRMAYEIGLRGDSALSEWMNGYNLPGVKVLPLLAADPDIGGGIYDDMGLPRPMPNDRTIRDAVRLMEDRPEFKPIIKYLLNHPDKLDNFKQLMDGLEGKETARSNGHAENGEASA